jgi:hypothetical protein
MLELALLTLGLGAILLVQIVAEHTFEEMNDD